MAAIEIPSLPSTDLTNMVNFIFKSPGTISKQAAKSLWSDAQNLAAMEEREETDDRSPEPRTPTFGASSSPSFDESNHQFGFRFSEIPTTVSQGKQTDLNVVYSKPGDDMNVKVFVSKPVPPNETPSSVSGDNPRYVMIPNETPSNFNIPNIVLEKAKQTGTKTKPPELPQVLVTSYDGKETSYVRFLNEPIPLPVQYEHHELDIDKYKKPADDYVEIQSVVDQKVMEDIKAIQRMEEQPAYQDSNVEHLHITVDQRVPLLPQTTGDVSAQSMEQSLYSTDSSEESSSNSQLVYQGYSEDVVEEVAAYQSVEESPVYTELKPRSHTTISAQEEDYHMDADTDEDEEPDVAKIVELNEKHFSKNIAATMAENPGLSSRLKNSLKDKIQRKRLQEGKGMLQVSFEDRPLGEPSEEEKEKARIRKLKNRESAVRSRQRRQDQMQEYEKEVKALDRENRKLSKEIEKLKEEIKSLSGMECKYGCFTTSGLNKQSEKDESSKSLQEAINDLLHAEEHT